jgi:HK97 gp10 family phage protein
VGKGTLAVSDFQFKLTGDLDGIVRKLKTLGPKLQAKAMRGAGTKAMRIVRDSARNKVRGYDDKDTPANIAKNIITRYDSKGSRKEGGMVMKVGVAGGARPKKGNEDTGHFRFVEFGKEGVPARPFLRPALESNAEKVASTFTDELSKAIDKLANA